MTSRLGDCKGIYRLWADSYEGSRLGGLRDLVVSSLMVWLTWSLTPGSLVRLNGQRKRRALNAGGWMPMRTRLATVKGSQPTHMPGLMHSYRRRVCSPMDSSMQAVGSPIGLIGRRKLAAPGCGGYGGCREEAVGEYAHRFCIISLVSYDNESIRFCNAELTSRSLSALFGHQ